MKRIRLWLWRMREASLEAQVLNGEAMLREIRALLIEKHRELRQIRTRIAERTPASVMLKEIMARPGRQQPPPPLASRQR